MDQEALVEDERASVNSILLTSSLLILIVVGYRVNTHRLRHVPESGVAIVLGFAFGVVVRVMGLAGEEYPLRFKSDLFFYVLLPPIIFEAGLSLEAQMFVDNLGSIAAFAVVGTVVSTWVTSQGLRLAAELSVVGLERTPHLGLHCHLFGALISATDPVATIALFGGTRFRTDPTLQSLINGEAVLNDAVAIVLFTTLQAVKADEEPRIVSLPVLGKFMLISSGSLLVGLAAGAACSWVFCRSRYLARFPDYEISAMVLVAYLTFAFSQLLGLSGIMALFFFGVVLAQYNWYNLSEQSKVASKVTFGTLAKLAESCVFLYLGVVAALSIGRFHWHMGLVFWSMVIITVARAAHVFPITMLLNPCRVRKITPNMKITLWVSGLRGAIAFALALRIPCADGQPASERGSAECRNSDLLITTTISIVVLTTLVVGAAMEKVMMALNVIEPVEPSSSMESPLDSPSLAAGSLSVPLASGGGPSAPGGVMLPADPSAGAGAHHPEGVANERSSASSGSRGSRSELSSRDLGADLTRGGASSGSRWSLRFNARGHFYQEFLRFDLNVLQPALGGPCRPRGGGSTSREAGETVELPSLQEFISAPGLQRGSLPEPEEDPPAWSRSAIFE